MTLPVSTAPAAAATAAAAAPAWWNVHARLMPDYNVKAAVYWWSMVVAGAAVLGGSLHVLARAPADVWWMIVPCTAFAMLAGLVPVHVPRSTSSFTAGEIFIFLLLLSVGVEAATLASACEALVATWRTSKRWTSRIGSPAMAAFALFGSGSLFEWLRAELRYDGVAADTLLLFGVVAFAFAYFVVNTLLMTTVQRLKRDEPLRLRAFMRSFGWLGVAYVANASVASFLHLSFRQSGPIAVVAALPVIAILLTTGHYFFRRKEADEAVRIAQASEAERARRHVLELEDSERRFHSAFTHASIGMALVSFDGRIRQVNAALRALLGMTDAPPHRLDFEQFVSRDGSTTLADMLASLTSDHDTPLAAELRCRHPDGRDVWVAVNGSFFSEPGSAEPCLILQVQDISSRMRAEAELHHIAFHDSLTGLPNRHRFNEHLVQAIARVQADPARQFGVLFLDFDRFKLINDSLGHTVGDEFLIQVSRRIGECVRGCDILARLGGDEFAILAEDRGTEQFAVHLAERLQETLRRPFRIGGTDVMTSASIGITFSSIGYAEPEEVLRDADIAMYKAKATGKARYAIFDVGLHQQVSNRLRLEGDLRRALADGEMSVDYQPLFDLADRRLVGFEALARWHHPELGTISPADFIPVAEESGSMVQLTDFVLNSACAQLKRWQLRAPRFATLKMHVNIAGNDVAASTLVSRIACAVMGARIRPEDLSIELTENILMERLESAIDMLNELHTLGIGLSVDDFGTGYSSLSHLSSLPLDSLKIDRSFVKNLRPGSKEAAVIRAIVLLGKSLGKEVIAEGIETPAQFDELRELGCDVGQGYYLSKPLAPAAVDALLEATLEAGFAAGRPAPRLVAVNG